MTKQLPCSKCGVMVDIPAKYARARSAVCLECSDTGATPFGKKFAKVFKPGWYAEHLKNLEQDSKQ